MKAVVCEAPGKMVVREAPTPIPRDGEVLVRVKASAICGSDIKAYKGQNPLIKLPIVLGHEFSGVVENVGRGVKLFSKGDRVAIEPSFVCNTCYFCSQKMYYLCDSLKQIGQQLSGSFAEYVIASAPFVYSIPENLSLEEASLIQPLAIALHAVNRSDLRRGDFAVVLGAGAIGQLVIQVAKQRGARILATDIFVQKLEKAREMGADHTLRGDDPDFIHQVLTLTGGRGADVVFEAAGSATTCCQSLEAVRKGGTVVLIGMTGHETEEVPLAQTTVKELSLLGTIRYAYGDYTKAIDMLSSSAIQVKPIIQRSFLLEETPRIFEDILTTREGILRAVMVTRGS